MQHVVLAKSKNGTAVAVWSEQTQKLPSEERVCTCGTEQPCHFRPRHGVLSSDPDKWPF